MEGGGVRGPIRPLPTGDSVTNWVDSASGKVDLLESGKGERVLGGGDSLPKGESTPAVWEKHE